MRQVVLVLCLFGLIYGQNYYQLYNGYQQSGSVYSGSSVCYALSGTTGNTMTVEVVAENAISLYVASASCSLDNYSYLVQNPVDGDRYTSAYVVNSTGNNYFVVYSNVYSSFTIKATTGTSVQLSTNQTYSGYAPSNSYLYFSFYATYDSFDVSITGTESTFYLKQNQMASYNNYDVSFYVDSAYSQVNSVGPCSNYVNNNAIGHWYIAVSSYYGSSFTIDINTPSASAFNPTSLTSGYNYVLLNYGYNYFQIAATANYGVELATTDYNSYSVQIAPLSSCTPVSWPYSASLSSTQSVVFYPNSTQVISIYSWQTAHYAYLDVTLISTLSTSGALPLTSSQYYYVALGDNNTMAYFSYDSTYAFTLSFNNYINVYVKQGSLPTPTDYDYFYPSLYYSQTVDPCNYLNYVNGETFYIGISYPIVSTVSISAYTSSYSTCYNNPYASSGDVGLIVGLSVGGFVLISLFVFLIVHFVRRRRFHHHHPSYAPLRKHNYVAVTTMPLDTYNNVRPPTAPPMIYQNYMPNGVSTAVPPPYMPPANNSYVQNNSYVPPPYAPTSNQQ